MKKIINWILNILIIIIVLIIAYLLWKNHTMKQVEVDNTKDALQNYEEVVCKNNQVVENNSNPQTTNEQVAPNQIIGYIMFPSLGTSTALLQGDAGDDQIAAMARGVSHDPHSSMPGEPGNTVFAGHRELFFKNFLKLNVGDDVIINIGDNIYIYKIQSFEVIDPTDVDKVFYPNDGQTLLMYTCYPIEAWKPFSQRMLVTATPISKTTVQDCKTITKTKAA